MATSHSFSIYLLKAGYNASNALNEGHLLRACAHNTTLPKDASLLILDNDPRPPWWREYFGIGEPLNQVLNGALVFLPVENRCFAISFGHVYHNLKDTGYEYDFGLRVTLNSVDAHNLRSTDTVEPGLARRQRTQLPIASDLTYFDFDRDSAILKSLTGQVKDEFKHLFKHATGASNLRISSAVKPRELPTLCTRLLRLYQSDAYEQSFPNIQNIAPIRDPDLLQQLNDALLKALCTHDSSLSMAVPDVINYRDNVCITFSGAGQSYIYDEVTVDGYLNYLTKRGENVNTYTVETLKRHALQLTNAEGTPQGDRFSIFRCLIYDASIGSDGDRYHLCEGHWYRVATEYLTRLKEFLDPRCAPMELPPYAHKDEEEYNHGVPEAQGRVRLCLDRKNIAPQGQHPVEPCDIYEVDDDGAAVLHHVKRSTRSKELSHLFNQGINSVELLKMEEQSRNRMMKLVGNNGDNTFQRPVAEQRLRVVYGIVTHKDPKGKSDNLPLFSRVSLMRTLKRLELYGVEAAFGFIPDQTTAKEPREKEKKTKKKTKKKKKKKTKKGKTKKRKH